MRKADSDALKQGSSPLTRGKQCRGTRSCSSRWLIPAHAGKTRIGGAASCQRRAHPRSRGENLDEGCLYVTITGSSPLTRGKPTLGPSSSARWRLIPAHAGKTRTARRPRRPGRAHPRSRGENPERLAVIEAAQGSSPLTRGKPAGTGPDPLGCRLIPAHAGKTSPAVRGEPPSGAHPRSRGENIDGQSHDGVVRGSSPLTRGKQPLGRINPHENGLIPAHAGKTGHSSRGMYFSTAHPRSRGENLVLRAPPAQSAGSSPLTRGKPRLGGRP